MHQHLLSRGCDPDNYHVHVDEVGMRATFMLYTLTGKLVGYQAYNPDGPKDRDGKDVQPRDLKYFTYATRSEVGLLDSVAVFGSERMDWWRRTVYLVEGVFDAIALHNLGLNALAALGNVGKGDRVPLRSLLRGLGMRVVAVVDGDAAGEQLGRYAHQVVRCPHGQDPASMHPVALWHLLFKEKGPE